MYLDHRGELIAQLFGRPLIAVDAESAGILREHSLFDFGPYLFGVVVILQGKAIAVLLVLAASSLILILLKHVDLVRCTISEVPLVISYYL